MIAISKYYYQQEQLEEISLQDIKNKVNSIKSNVQQKTIKTALNHPNITHALGTAAKFGSMAIGPVAQMAGVNIDNNTNNLVSLALQHAGNQLHNNFGKTNQQGFTDAKLNRSNITQQLVKKKVDPRILAATGGLVSNIDPYLGGYLRTMSGAKNKHQWSNLASKATELSNQYVNA